MIEPKINLLNQNQSMNGKVLEILIAEAAGEEVQSKDEAILEVGKGIVGDRYYFSKGTFSEILAGKPDAELTLIEKEQIDQFDLISGCSYKSQDFRRNIVTEGIDLNHLVGKDFLIGSVRIYGIRLCEPCSYLAGLLDNKIMENMIHKAGLRAQILSNGTICVNQEIKLEST